MNRVATGDLDYFDVGVCDCCGGTSPLSIRDGEYLCDECFDDREREEREVLA